MNALAPIAVTASMALTVQAEVDAARSFAMAEKSEATRRAYRSDFAIFTAWCAARGVQSMPAAPETVNVFLASQAMEGVKASTLGRRFDGRNGVIGSSQDAVGSARRPHCREHAGKACS
jgi:site-specific recombinase XerC